MKILLRDFNAKVRTEDIFIPGLGNESLHEISTVKDVTVVNFAMSENLIINSIVFPHRTIHKYTWTSPDLRTRDQIEHTFINMRRHSNIADVQSFRRADNDKVMLKLWTGCQ
jgi:hypothetical protein